MQTTLVDKNKQETFDCWSEFIEHCKNVPNCGYEDSSHRESLHFTGTQTFEDAVKLAEFGGWKEGEDKAKGLAASLENKVTSLIERPIFVNDIAGMSIDMGAYVMGAPDCWIAREQRFAEDHGTKILRVVVNCTASAGVSKEVMIARGAAAAALVQALEWGGNRVELWVLPIACLGNRSHEVATYESRVLIKRADQDLDLGRVIFAMAHPSTLRRFGFAAVEKNRVVAESLGSWYGMPHDTQFDKGDIYITRGMLGEPQWENVEDTIRWILNNLKEQGIKLHEGVEA